MIAVMCTVYLTDCFSDGGILSLYNISKDTSGFFICTSSNKIRSATCNLTLSVMPREINLLIATIWDFTIPNSYIFATIYYSIYPTLILLNNLFHSCSFHEHWLHCRNHCWNCGCFVGISHRCLLLLLQEEEQRGGIRHGVMFSTILYIKIQARSH